MDTSKVAVVMVPLPAQGHLNQFLNMSRLLSAHGLSIHFIGSPTHNRQAKLRVHGWEPSTVSNIYFHDLHLPSFLTPSPNPHAPIKFPAHFQPLFDCTKYLREPLAALLESLSTAFCRVVVIHDSVMSFAAKEASLIPNGEAYAFHTVSTLAILFYNWEGLGKPVNDDIMMPHELPCLSLEDCFTEDMMKFIEEQYEFMKFVVGDLYNTCRPTEGRFFDLLGQEKFLGSKKQWAIGPLNPVSVLSNGESRQRHYSLNWLDKQPKTSVLYVSFGTMTSISDEQIIELAMGLEHSHQKFVWVLREADRGDIFAIEKENRKIELPEGYEERVNGVGLIARDWAPQLEILAHPSTGGFLSHCGWNSCMESFTMGVPIGAWPMHSDQPRNAMLVTDVLKVGMVVRDWARRKEVLSSSYVECAVNKLMEGEEVRKRAESLGKAVREATSEDGTSANELISFVAHVSR